MLARHINEMPQPYVKKTGNRTFPMSDPIRPHIIVNDTAMVL